VLYPALFLAGLAVGTAWAAAMLVQATWPYRAPAAAILLWQALGLSWGLAAVGALAAAGAVPARFGVTGGALAGAGRALRDLRLSLGVSAGLVQGLRLLCVAAGAGLLVLLCWVLLAASAAVFRARRRQRVLLSLLARGDPKAPGAVVVDHAPAAAYCVPGLRSHIVISTGTLNLLDPAELAAVLAHERAHLRERHDLVLLPFTALRRAFPWARLPRQAQCAVSLLIEMLADDYARRRSPARQLATALMRVGAQGAGMVPSGALAVAAEPAEVATRVARLLTPAPRLPRHAVALVCAVAVALVVAPVALLVFPV
jgi:Zn-dependent protease with chaperone function